MNAELLPILKTFPGRRVLVWGDLILDEYIYTSTSRISREAPVLVTEFLSNRHLLGGAGNVVMNVRALEANPIPIGFLGDDEDGATLLRLLRDQDIDTDHLLALPSHKTPKKSRIMSGGENTKKQQVLRIDTLNRHGIGEEHRRALEDRLLALIEGNELLIVSDYIFESVHPRIFQSVRDAHPDLLITIDSRNHLIDFPGITFATPNEPELRRIFPGRGFRTESEFFSAGRELLERLRASGVLLKRGQNGMIAFEPERPPMEIGIHGGTEIVDVTGAGDTVISVFGLAVHAGAGIEASARLAAIAAGIVVMKEGAYPIHIHELEKALAVAE